MIRLLMVLTFMTVAYMVGYNIGRYHRSAYDLAIAAQLRIEYYYERVME